jgi:hypothetical protein
MKSIFTQSKHFKKEYSCDIVRIGQMAPVEGSDFLAKTEIYPGMPIVVRKDEVNVGDVMFYVNLECQICHEFLALNNQYNDPELNIDSKIKGFFNKNGRVRLIKLRGQQSMGYLFGIDSMNKYLKENFKPTIDQTDLENQIGTSFDEVGGEIFVKAYIPEVSVKNTSHNGRFEKKRNSRLKQFDKIIPGEFQFHYDTDQLEKNIQNIDPDEVVDICIKLHGTSAIIGNVLINKHIPWYKKPLCWFNLIETTEYGNIYSSRSVIKNRYINKNVTDGYYNEDIWGVWNERVKDFIDNGITIYGEIVGFTPNGQPIQKVGKSIFDYGCNPCESKLMIYRVTRGEEEGKIEYTIPEVIEYTKQLKKRMILAGSEYVNNILEDPIVYSGTLHNRYKNITIDENWRTNVLHALANDQEFLMEKDEPMCYNKVPREGLVLRKRNDVLKEAFKLKTMRFRNKEADAIDKGQIDTEIIESEY